MPSPLIAEYQALARSLDPLIKQLIADGHPIAAQQVCAAQGTLRAACLKMIANDIDTLLDPADPNMATATQTLAKATTALKEGAASITSDENRVTTIVSIATAATQIASSLVPLNISEIIAAGNNTVSLIWS
jgi:hypothetical protein